MLRLTINGSQPVSDTHDIKYNLVSHNEDGYLIETLPAERNYRLSDGDLVTLMSSRSDGTNYLMDVPIVMESGMTQNQFRINNLDDIELDIFNIQELRYDNGTLRLNITFNNNPYLEKGQTFHLLIRQPYSLYGGESSNFIETDMEVLDSNQNSVITQFSGVLNGIPADFLQNLAINPENWHFFSITKKNDNFFRDGYLPQIKKKQRDYVVPLDFGNIFATNAYQEDEVTTNFVEVETEKAINPIVNMEKIVYQPAYVPSDNLNDDTKRGQNLPLIEEIEVNLHFRERDRSDANLKDWQVIQTGYWNGYRVQGNRLTPKDGSFSNSKLVTFDSPDSQSDLLTYLNFENSDVKYQKNRLKKSFLRFLFYDSKDTANQKLLYYSTIFMDSGKYFGKYLKYGDSTQRYWIADTSNSGNTTFEVGTGMTVDAELDREAVTTDEEREERRLSCRFSIRDKYQSDASSEGFYLYLFSEDDPRLRPKDIYMRVEFNHAGYGRTIPFMMPVREATVGGDYPYFEPISIEDADFPYEGYRLNQYYENLFIQLKYVYDKVNNRYVYYLPQPLATVKDNNGLMKMVLNLYEVKVQ